MIYFYILIGLMAAHYATFLATFRWRHNVMYLLSSAFGMAFEGFFVYTLYHFLNLIESAFGDVSNALNTLYMFVQSRSTI